MSERLLLPGEHSSESALVVRISVPYQNAVKDGTHVDDQGQHRFARHTCPAMFMLEMMNTMAHMYKKSRWCTRQSMSVNTSSGKAVTLRH